MTGNNTGGDTGSGTGDDTGSDNFVKTLNHLNTTVLVMAKEWLLAKALSIKVAKTLTVLLAVKWALGSLARAMMQLYKCKQTHVTVGRRGDGMTAPRSDGTDVGVLTHEHATDKDIESQIEGLSEVGVRLKRFLRFTIKLTGGCGETPGTFSVLSVLKQRLKNVLTLCQGSKRS